MTLTLQSIIRDVVTENPAAADVFEKLDVDYSCRGGRALGDVLSESGISLQAFMGEVDQVARLRSGNPSSPNWRFVSLRSLIRHIVDTHHAYLRVELPALDKWIARISERHPGERELLLGLQRAIQRFERDMEVQMRKEEAVLFPAISDMENGAPLSDLQFGSVANLSRVMQDENIHAAGALKEICLLSKNYACPPDTSTALRTLFEKLRVLTAHTHQHLHLENNILLPRAISLEKGETSCN